jgi:transposase
MASTGCQWRQIPREFPPYSTVQSYFYGWSRDGTFAQIDHVLGMACRQWRGARRAQGRRDRQPVGEDHRERRPRGYDAGKKIKGRKRHIVTDTQGNLVGLVVHTADIQDRDGAVDLLASISTLCRWLRQVFADGGYAGDKLRNALTRIGQWTVEIYKPSAAARGFVLLPRRWVVERTVGRLGRCRRLAKDFETSLASATAGVFIGHIRLLTRRLARP